MITLLSGQAFTVEDFGRMSKQNGSLNPVTFGERIDKKEPGEVALTFDQDYCSEQALDYIFQLNPKKAFSQPAL